MIRLHLVSLISPLPPYGFRSNLVPMERSFRGESNGIGCKKFGGELAEDVGNYSEMNRLAQIRDISSFSRILQEIPPSLSCLRLEDLESLVGSCIGLQSEPQL